MSLGFLSVIACAIIMSSQVCGPAHASSKPELESAIVAKKRLEQIKAGMEAILARRVVKIAIPGLPTMRPQQLGIPSKLLERRTSPGPRIEQAFATMLDDALARRAIATLYPAGCDADDDPPQSPAPSPGSMKRAPSADQVRIAKSLDALVTLVLISCPVPMHAINTSSTENDSNAKWLHAESERRRAAALNQPFQVVAVDVDALIVGQTFRFQDASDADTRVPAYVRDRLNEKLDEVQRAFAPLAHASGKNRVVFDRDKTASRKSLHDNPRGWFNAIAEDGITYISPTLARAVFAGCSNETSGIASLIDRLESDIKAERSRPAAQDLVGITRLAHDRADRVDKCIASDASFLFAHELSHSVLGLLAEEQADCMASAYTALTGAAPFGVFDKAIFRMARGQDADRLGADAGMAAQIQCREKRIKSITGPAGQTLMSAYAACSARTVECEH